MCPLPLPPPVLSSRQFVGVPGLGGGGHRYCRGPWPHSAHQPGSGCALQEETLETGLHWVRTALCQRRVGEKKSGFIKTYFVMGKAP